MGNCFRKSSERLNFKTLPAFFPSFSKCWVIKVCDGDTLWVSARVNGTYYKFNIRLYGYDAWELKSENPKEKERALESKEALSQLVVGRELTIKIIPKKEKYGRLLAIIYDTQGKDIVPQLVKEGRGREYDGGRKGAFDETG